MRPHLSLILPKNKFADSSKEREILIKEVAKSTVSIPNMSDDEPLSIWIQALKKAHATSKLVYMLKPLFHTYCLHF